MESTSSARTVLTRVITAYRITQCLAAIVRFRIPDLLEEGPRSADALAAAVGLNADRLARILDLLAAEGIFNKCKSDFGLNDVSKLLVSRRELAYREWLLCETQPSYWRSWLGLDVALKGDSSGFEAEFGRSFFEHLSHDTDSQRLFHATMTAFTRSATAALLGHLNFSGDCQVVDVGGGEGELLAQLLEAHPNVHGVLTDLGEDLPKRAQALRPFVNVGRAELVPGNFFESLPSGGDVYVMKKILHDWDDQDAQRILVNCRRAMADDGKLVIIERVIDEQGGGRGLDALMLVLLGGKERTRNDFEALLGSAGFALSAVHFPDPTFAILEARPYDLLEDH